MTNDLSMTNEQIVHQFYSAFQKLDYVAMQNYYSDAVIFQDPVFGLLEGSEVKAMWEMFCKNANDFSLTYSVIAEDEEYWRCLWTATYIFSKTGRKVENKIQAYLRIQNGVIQEHTDYFNFWRWSYQTFGWIGWLLGWSSFFKSQVRSQARDNLNKFMNRNPKSVQMDPE